MHAISTVILHMHVSLIIMYVYAQSMHAGISSSVNDNNPLFHGTYIYSLSISLYIYYLVANYKITYFVATLSYDNYYVNLRDYSNSTVTLW